MNTWDDYPILNFSEVPEIETAFIERRGEPALGVGECAAGPIAAAIANAIAHALGVRARDMPLTPDRITAAIKLSVEQDIAMKIGICGTGRMGAAIGQRLIAEGHTLVAWNRNAAKTNALVDLGASRAATPAALVDACDTTIVMLLNDAAMQAVYGGDNAF